MKGNWSRTLHSSLGRRCHRFLACWILIRNILMLVQGLGVLPRNLVVLFQFLHFLMPPFRMLHLKRKYIKFIKLLCQVVQRMEKKSLSKSHAKTAGT